MVTSYTARYPINKFGCQGKRIVLGLQRDVIHLLEFKDNKFHVMASDDEIHNCTDIKALNENLFVGIDRWGECFLTRLQQGKQDAQAKKQVQVFTLCFLPIDNNGGHRLKTLLTCQLGESPISVKVLVHWMRRYNTYNNSSSSSEKGGWIVQSVDEKDRGEVPLSRYNDLKPVSVALISTLSGSLIRLLRLCSETFSLLKGLEITLSKHAFGRPLLGHSYFYFRGRYRVNHVDGDMVKQFLSLTADEQIRITGLMESNPNPLQIISTLNFLFHL